MHGQVIAYGMVPIGQPAAQPVAASPAAGIPAGFGLPTFVNRWESAAVGAVVIVAAAVLANAFFDEL